MSESPWGEAASEMIVTTTHNIDGRPVQRYCGVVTGEVIVGDQDADHVDHAEASVNKGITASNRVPAPGALVMTRWPWSRATRSSMFLSPKPPRLCAGSSSQIEGKEKRNAVSRGVSAEVSGMGKAWIERQRSHLVLSRAVFWCT